MSEPESCQVTLAELVRDEKWYPRQGLSPERVADYAIFYKEGGPNALPPICVGTIPGIDAPWLTDGWHRVAAAEKARLDRLPALVQPYRDRWEAFADAIRLANCGPLSLQPAEKGRHVDAFLQEFPEASDRELARQLGVSHVYVWKRRQKRQRATTPEDPLVKPSRELA